MLTPKRKARRSLVQTRKEDKAKQRAARYAADKQLLEEDESTLTPKRIARRSMFQTRKENEAAREKTRIR